MYNYSQPESLSFRIALAVCQKNIEQTYMTDVNAAIISLQKRSVINSHHSPKRSNLKIKKKKFLCSIKKRYLQLSEKGVQVVSKS